MDLEEYAPIGMMLTFFVVTSTAYLAMGSVSNWVHYDTLLMEGTVVRAFTAGVAGSVTYYILEILFG